MWVVFISFSWKTLVYISVRSWDCHKVATQHKSDVHRNWEYVNVVILYDFYARFIVLLLRIYSTFLLKQSNLANFRKWYIIIHLTTLYHISRCWNVHRQNTGRPNKMSTPHILLVNLALSLLLFYITFLFGIKQTGRDIICRTSSALTLYFLLVSFSWMLVEGVAHYVAIAFVFHKLTDGVVRMLAFVAWGKSQNVSTQTLFNRSLLCSP